MTDIKIPLKTMLKLIEGTMLNVYESKSTIVTSIGGLTLWAVKEEPTKIFKDSIPFVGIGYRSVSMVDEKSCEEDWPSILPDNPDELKKVADIVVSKLKSMEAEAK